MRFVALDVETTGINKRGDNDVVGNHRIIEIALVEIVDNVITGKYFHSYLNPQRSVSSGAFKVHGITDSFLQGKPGFSHIVTQFLDFIGDSPVVIHNAPFDTAFIDMELSLLPVRLRPRTVFQVIDTLDVARALFPGMKNDLDSLCFRFGLKPKRQVHGALKDAIELANIFLVIC